MSEVRTLTVFTRRNPDQTADGLRRVIELAKAEGVRVQVPAEEVDKHGLVPVDGVDYSVQPDAPTDLAVVLGGDGTILSTLRRFAGTDVPVFAVNFGAVGFLATVEVNELESGLRRALKGQLEILTLPALTTVTSSGPQLAVNDISFHRRPSLRVAELGYSVVGEQIGEVRCDGLVVSTPAGSTGYNLANGGPVLAWGVEGYIVSFIAPHTLTARALVAASTDVLQVVNLSREEPVDLTTDGRPVCALEPQERVEVRFEPGRTLLAQEAGETFYKRLSDKFGHLTH